MTWFKITVSIPLYNPSTRSNTSMKLEGEFENKNEHEAVKDAKEWYAMECGTTIEEINIVKVVEINDRK